VRVLVHIVHTAHQFICDGFENSLCFLQHLIVPKTHHAQTKRFQFPGSIRIINSLLVIGMSAAVKFNDQSSFMAVKIGDIAGNGMLPAEFETQQLAVAQQLPEQVFGVGGIFAQ